MNGLLKTLRSVRVIGWANALRALRSAGRRDRLDARYPGPPRPIRLAFPGPLQDAELALSGARFRFYNSLLDARFLAPDLLYLGWDGAPMQPSYAALPADWPAVDVTLELAGDRWRLSSCALTLDVAPDGSLRLLDAAGVTLREDAPPVWDEHGWLARSELPAVSAISGLGERAAGLDLRPGRYALWNTDPGGSYGPGADPLYIGMPLYFALRGGRSTWTLVDNATRGQVTLDAEPDAGVELRLAGGQMRYYVAVGRPAALLARLGELTGRAPLPPRWALGYHQSQWGYNSEDELRRIWGEFQARELPLSGLWLDIDHLRGYRVFTLDEERYPTLPELARDLRKAGAHLVAIVDPGVKRDPDFDVYREGRTRGAFCIRPDGRELAAVVWPGWTVWPDFASPQARTWWGELYERPIARGIDGFWHDMNEPAAFCGWGEQTLPLSTVHWLDNQAADHRRVHNLYGSLMNRAGYEGLRRLLPEKRPFILTRSGWIGVQRHAWTWTADAESTWPALRGTIASVLGLALCGVPYSGPDVGGYSGAPDAELFVRWFQLAAHLPFFRTHSAFYLPRREPWEFGPAAEAILRQQLLTRYRRLPLLYTLAWRAAQEGAPLVRPLWWADPDDATLWPLDDAFLLGDHLLVAPVVEAGARSRTVPLPAGSWYDEASGERIAGGRVVELDAPLERIPVLVRAGAVLPLADGDSLELHVYRPDAGQSGGGLLYSDAGDGYGPSRVDRWTLRPAGAGFELLWESEGDYPWPYMSLSLCLHGLDAAAVEQDGETLPLDAAGRCAQIRPGLAVNIPAG